MAGLAAVGGLVAAEPGVDVTLPAGLQRQLAGGEPVQQRDGGLDVLLDADGLLVRSGPATEPAAQASLQVPDGETVQQLPFPVHHAPPPWPASATGSTTGTDVVHTCGHPTERRAVMRLDQ